MCDGHAWMDIHMIGYCLELAKQHHKLSAIAQTHATIQKSIVLNKRQSFSEYDGYIIVFMSCVSSSGCRGSDASPPSAGESGRMRRRAYSPPELYAIPTTGTSITIASASSEGVFDLVRLLLPTDDKQYWLCVFFDKCVHYVFNSNIKKYS